VGVILRITFFLTDPHPLASLATSPLLGGMTERVAIEAETALGANG
jgi:hypothetical protein